MRDLFTTPWSELGEPDRDCAVRCSAIFGAIHAEEDCQRGGAALSTPTTYFTKMVETTGGVSEMRRAAWRKELVEDANDADPRVRAYVDAWNERKGR